MRSSLLTFAVFILTVAVLANSTFAQQETPSEPNSIDSTQETEAKKINGSEDIVSAESMNNLRLQYEDVVLFYVKNKLKSDDKFVDIYWEKNNKDQYTTAKSDSFKMKELKPTQLKEYQQYMKNLTGDIIYAQPGKILDYDQKKKAFPLSGFEDQKKVRLDYMITPISFSTVPDDLKSRYPSQFALYNSKTFSSHLTMPEEKAKKLNAQLAGNDRSAYTVVSARIKSFDDTNVKAFGLSKVNIEIKKVSFYVWNSETSKYEKISEL